MPKPWPEDKKLYLGFLIESGMNNVEIASELGKSRSLIQLAARRYLGGNPNYRLKKTKHRHLREPVFKYFLDHTWQETMERFKLTESELKSLFTVGYRMPELAHLRKDTRVREAWSAEALIYMLQRVGLVRREKIGEHLKRGNHVRVIKEKLRQLGVNSKTLQGMTLSTYRRNFGQEPSLLIQTKAGPGGGHTGKFDLIGKFKIVPWVILRKELELGLIQTPKLFEDYIKAMALFQDWIFRGGNIVRKMHKIINESGEK